MVHTKQTLKLIKKAERKYPKGTKFNNTLYGDKRISKSTGQFGFIEDNSICIIIDKNYFGGMVYNAKKNKWADVYK